MSKDSSSARPVPQISSSILPVGNEAAVEYSSACVPSSSENFPNDENAACHPLPSPPPPWRTPLNSIPDPSQIQVPPCKDKPSLLALSESLLNPPQQPRVPKLVNSEPNSAQSTPAKGSHSRRAPKAAGSVSRLPGGPGGVPLQVSDPHAEIEVPHFELAQHHSFWKHYNVQVLIRMRPLSNVEKESQGNNGRCLRQESSKTLVWLGHPETRFTFDHIASETISQEKLFTVAGLPMVDNCMSGYNSCMFAYGQTGSGKTYTMMGDINHLTGCGNLNEDCGITPRIFEYLFTRIREEEDKRRGEGLKYSCKCSFLEIYNEQITDLLEPSSTNLQLREDLKKCVYVENLTEYSVSTVDDVLRLLLQGAANRKMAATHMNSESSRSHSVFTCVIESRWEKDSMTHFRFGRINLVDLAGSERQKSSGAEGDRLKEAANINKSLSTLGLVIMSLVDLAQGKQRHVPYRDSRLTFLLQDSLGGNSKTTIIANVSPSFCSANETLSTLKFAQRAKLIQNNAKVNEDASGDVTALQWQIQQLKGQLSILLKHTNSSDYFSHYSPRFKDSSFGDFLEGFGSSKEMSLHDNCIEEASICRKGKLAFQRSDSTDDLPSHILSENGTLPCEDGLQMGRSLVLHNNNMEKELMDAKSLIEVLQSKQICLIEELELLRGENQNLKKINQELRMGCHEDRPEPGYYGTGSHLQSEDLYLVKEGENGTSKLVLQAKLDKLSEDLKDAQLLNTQYLENHAMELFRNHKAQIVQAEVEAETTKTILYLQEEIATLQSELQGRLVSLSEENASLRNFMLAKEGEIKALCSGWERATFELTNFLLDGSKSLKDASSQIESIASLFPCESVWISEHVERAAKSCLEKEENILLLTRFLEDAQRTVLEMDKKLTALRGAAIALTEVQQMKHFKNKSMYKEDNETDDERCTNSDFLWLNEDSHQTLMVLGDGLHQMVEDHEKMMQTADGGCNLTREADHFFTKFEEVQETMKEADYVLKSNEDSKHLTSIWKQAGTDILAQRENLVEEFKELTSSIHSQKSTNELLPDQIHFILSEITSLMFLLQGPFQQDVEDMCKMAYSDSILLVKETLNNIDSLRSSLKDISFLHHSHLREHLNAKRKLHMSSNFCVPTVEKECVPVYNTGKCEKKESQTETVAEAGKCGLIYDDLIAMNLELKRKLDKEKALLKGLLFDFNLLQESTSSAKDAKDEIKKLIVALNQVQNELKMKTAQLDDMLVQNRTLEGRLAKTENALSVSNSDLEQIRGTLDILSEHDAELRMILNDHYLKKSKMEQQLQEQKETIEYFENEIVRMAALAEENLSSSVKDIKDEMARMTLERDELLDRIQSQQDKLDIAYALIDEKEAITLEARQESEASKVYAEQKEEEVKILEHSVEELESTINALEKKVYEMEEAVERHRRIRNVEIHNMRERLLMFENMTEDLDSKNSSGELSEKQIFRKLHTGSVELCNAHIKVRTLEQENEKLAKEIKQYREYSFELLVHAEAQASQYQQKFKNLELMVHEVKNLSEPMCGAATLDRAEKNSVRVRGSSSPFRCIASLVQQMNLEKDQELSIAKLRIEELEASVASRQKEVCLLNTRLASVESMTHDVIRDLLGVKLDITNYADLVSENQLQKLVQEAQQQAQQYIMMEKEVAELKRQITDLVEERERCIFEVKRREADVLAAHMALEQMRERDQLLTAQNEMLKADKTNLQRRVAELDDMAKKLYGTRKY